MFRPESKQNKECLSEKKFNPTIESRTSENEDFMFVGDFSAHNFSYVASIDVFFSVVWRRKNL